MGDQVQQDFTLEVGAVTEQVTVSAGAELLQALASDKGQVVGEENVHDLPSQARNPFLLGIVATGVQFDIGANALSRSARPFDAGNNVAESMSINGGLTGSSDLLLDGVPNTGVETGSQRHQPGFRADSGSGVGIQDAEQQLRRAVRAHLRRHHDGQHQERDQQAPWGGLLVKQEHASQPTPSTEPERAARAAYHENNPGLEFDGPVLIPHVYDGRNKTFFMYSYEIWRDSIPAPSTETRAAAVGGAGELHHHAAKQRPTRSRSTIRPPRCRRDQTYTRQPFPGDMIPPNRLNPVGLKIASYIPAPNIAGQTNNLVTTPNQRTDAYDAHVIRIDQVINDRERFFSRFVRGYRTEVNGTGGFAACRPRRGTPTPTGA